MKKLVCIILSACMLLALTACGASVPEEPEIEDQTSQGVLEDGYETDGAGSDYRHLLQAFDYGNAITYVIGHKNPDSDTVGSAVAYANLLNALGIQAKAVVSGPVNSETQYALDIFGISAPPVLDNAEGKQFVLVDHSTYAQAIDGMQNARVVGIVDHHGIGDVTTSEQINVRSAPAGAAASLVYLAYQECGVSISKDMARIMLMSILSDTRNMARNVTAADQSAFDALCQIAEIDDINALYLGMAQALTSYGDMTEWEIFQSDYKEYEAGGIKFCIGDVNAYGEDAVRELAERMYQVMEDNYDTMGLDMLFTIINNKSDDESENMMYMVAYGSGAEDLLQEIYGNYDGVRFFVFKENLSRKADVVPAISAALQ